MCSTCFPRSSLPADASLSSTGSSRASSPASTVLSKRYDALQPSRRTSFPSLGGTSDALAVFAPGRTSAPPRPGVGHPVSPAGNSPRSEQGSPKFLGNLNCPFANVPIRRRQDCSHQTVHSAAAWPLVIERQRLPRKVFRRSIAWLSNSLSTLRSEGYPAPRKTRFQLLVRLYWTGFAPARFR